MNSFEIYKLVTALSMTFCYVSSIQFSACQDSRKNNLCNMTCETVDFQQRISFKRNGTSRGSCTPPFGCNANLYQEAPNKTVFTIPSLSYSNDIGEWTCSYGSTETQPQFFIVYGSASTPNITKYDPPVNSVDVESVELTAVLECAYPATPSTILEFDEEGQGNYKTFKTVQQLSVSAPTLGQCSDNLESIVTAKVGASYNENNQALAGKRGYLRVKFFYNTKVEFITPGIGEYTFKLEQINSACGSFHCGFWLLWLVIVTSIIILFLMWKKVKRFGFSASGCSNMKIGITVVFSVVAIGTGLGLGLGLREGQANCLECGATIGISIALGVALSVIEFIVIIKCDKEKVSVFRAVINITSESYTDNLKDCTSRAYKDLSRRVTKAIESLYKNVTGQQTVVDLKFSPGLKVTFDLSSQGFDDCSVLSGTLNNALQSGLISPFKVNSVGFEFMPLQDWKDSKGEASDRSNGDRARSPASASAIKVEAENKSHNKPTGKKTEESSLHIKSYGSPLPEVPKVRHNQLDPIGEMDNKPYTKLYGSPLPEVPQVRSNQLDRIERQDIDEVESPKVEKKKKKKKKNRKKNEDSVDNEEDN